MFDILKKIKKLFDPNEWELKKLQKFVDQVNELEASTEKLSDKDLKDKTAEFRKRLSEGATTDDILPEAFAVVREVSRRTMGMRHFNVQIIGGVVLHQGRVAEMKTGEGKTLSATLPVYLNALTGKGVHVVTVNDYLAKRDARWMGPIYHFLGMSVGIIQHDVSYMFDPAHIVGDESLDLLRQVTRREAYAADITYGTNNEFGFDYLRDNMVMDEREKVQRELHYAIIDEVDSILIDEARTPLIISGMGTESSDDYKKFARIASRLEKDTHYTVFEKEHSVAPSEEGYKRIAEYMGLPKKRAEFEYRSEPLIVFPDITPTGSNEADEKRVGFIKWYNKGNLALNNKNTKDAITDYEKAITKESEHAEAFSNLAVACYRQGDTQKSVENMEKAVQLLSGSADMWFNMGFCYKYSNMFEKAAGAYQKALELRPDFYDALNNLGVVYMKMGEHDAAIDSFNKAVQLGGVNDGSDESMAERNLDEAEEARKALDADAHTKFPGYQVSDIEETDFEYYIQNSLKAKELFKLDVDYVIKDNQIIIVDEFTGRLMFGRRYSDGLHQAIEAKENVKVRAEDQTLASITFQNYFRMYEKLSGMTGTAATEEKEFRQIYNMDVVIIPTNMPNARDDMPDRIYKNEEIKIRAVVKEIEEMNKIGRPVLVGTRSIEKSEIFSHMLKKRGIKHNVLNAKHHEKEAQIISEAGREAAVTIATNMAGRGVDIVLGGVPPSYELEERKYESAKNHLELVRTQLETMKEQLEVLEGKYPGRQEELEKQKVLLDELMSKAGKEDVRNRVKETRQKIEELEAEVSGMNSEIRELKGRIQMNVGQLPELEKAVKITEKTYKERKKEVSEKMKDYVSEQERVKELGGLHIIGTERHESRRIDNQLRGRSGRQGDKGSSRFFVGLDDELMRLFGSDKLPDWLKDWAEDEDVPLEHGLFTSSIQKAQERVEMHHFSIRKNVLDYDDVMNQQRKIIYEQRNRIIKGEDLKPVMQSFIDEYVDHIMVLYASESLSLEEWDIDGLHHTIRDTFWPLPDDAVNEKLQLEDRKRVRAQVEEWAKWAYDKKEEDIGPELMNMLIQWVLLHNVDQKWMDHLHNMDELRDGISLRAYGQRDPLIEYINESHEYFEAMNQSIQHDTVKQFFRSHISPEALEQYFQSRVKVTREHRGGGEESGGTTVRKGVKVGRNDPCPCGSGKKYKRCCGRM